jgi:hypothetical protein
MENGYLTVVLTALGKKCMKRYGKVAIFGLPTVFKNYLKIIFFSFFVQGIFTADTLGCNLISILSIDMC